MEFPQKLYVYLEQYENDDPIVIAAESLSELNAPDGNEIAVYELRRVGKVVITNEFVEDVGATIDATTVKEAV